MGELKCYFYTDPLKAAWMQKHYGMEFVDIKGHNIKIRDNYDGFVVAGAFPRRAFIRSDSLHLLEPQVGDLIIDYIGTPLFESESLRPELGKIIQRKNVAFFWPEVEP